MKITPEILTRHGLDRWRVFKALYPNIGEAPTFTLSRRLRVTIANCDHANRVIDFRENLFSTHGRLMLVTVLPHELAHLVDYDLHGDTSKTWENQGHSETWCNIMLNYGLEPNRFLHHSLRPVK